MEDINFIIMMLQLKNTKGKKPFTSVQKSNTSVTLPTIHKTIAYNQSERTYNKSSYLQIAENLSSNIEYDKKNTIYINNEQSKLKNILKKMNNDTLDMINNIKPRRVQRTKSKTQLSTIADKEVENSKKMISNLQYQIGKLKEKYARIIDHGQEQNVLEKIKSVKEQIQMMKQQNLEARLSVDKEGNTIIKEFGTLQDPKVKALESDSHLTGLRLNKLRAQTTRVEDQTKKIATKTKQLQTKMKSLQEQYNSLKSKQQEEAALKNKELLVKEKKSQILSIKQKFDDKTTMSKQKYYKILKILEQIVANSTSTQSKIAQVQKKCNQTKQQSAFLEVELRQSKRIKMEKSRVVQQYLSSHQRTEPFQKNANEFISENSTDFLKPQRIKSQFQELAEEKDLNRDITDEEKREVLWALQGTRQPQTAKMILEENMKKEINDADESTKHKVGQLEKPIQHPIEGQVKAVQPK